MHHQSGIIRVMPNAPSSVLAGIAALCPGRNVSTGDLKRAVSIFECVGKTVVIRNEALMDVVTGLSGSGPAFVFLVIESLSDAGVQLGISRKEASLLAAQTAYGAAKMLLETGRHPSELKDIVATPGGTTFAGLKMLEKGNFRSTIMDAVEAATERSRDLGALINNLKKE
jgi:pyrroline-5-carboxylate reductase